MKLAFNKKTLDNITVVMIALEGLHQFFAKMESKSVSQNKVTSQNTYNDPKTNKLTYKH